MISLIICTKNRKEIKDLELNIEKTIGLAYELIVIEDHNGSTGLCKAYNQGARRAQYDVLCFMHDDIRYETENWGQVVCSVLEDRTIGLLGIAGGVVKTQVPSDWEGRYKGVEAHLIQHYKYRAGDPILFRSSYSGSPLAEVVVLDGTWLCSRKDVFENMQFDEQTFPGFHGYDIDYSLQVGQKYRVCVTFNVLVQHFSDGNYSAEWIRAALKLGRKWERYLPVYTNAFPVKELPKVYSQNLKAFLKILVRSNFSFVFVFSILVRYSIQLQFMPLLYLRLLGKVIEYKIRIFLFKKI